MSLNLNYGKYGSDAYTWERGSTILLRTEEGELQCTPGGLCDWHRQFLSGHQSPYFKVNTYQEDHPMSK